MRRVLLLGIALAALVAWPPSMAPLLGANSDREQIEGGDFIRSEWLDEKITVEEAERQNPGLPNDDRAERFPEIRKPFAFLSAKWEALKAQMQPGDELWTFSSSAESWRHLAGRAGIALVRDKKVIATIVTRMN